MRYLLNYIRITFFSRAITKLCCVFFSQGCYIGDEGLSSVGECCNFLQDLNLRFCEGLTDRGLVQLALGCGKTLKSLGVAACAQITDVSLEAVGSHCRSLESLSLDSEIIHDKGLLVVAKRCSTLKVLKLQCLNITDEALQAVGNYCSSLEVLALYSFQKFTDRYPLSPLDLLSSHLWNSIIKKFES